MSSTMPPLKILIVDDNPELLDVFAHGLPLLGDFTVFTAEDGSSGLEACYQHRPDCVVVDIRMPGLNGQQLVKTLRGDPATAQTPIIVLTALPHDQAEFSSFAAGTDVFVMKPLVPRELVEAIKMALFVDDEERAQRLRLLVEEGDE